VRIKDNFPLECYNTFHIPVKTRWFAEYDSEEELCRLLSDEYFMECRSLHIGGGSNLLFVNDFDGIIVHSCIKGIETVCEETDSAVIRTGAGELWDAVVGYAVSNGLYGIENLSHIPGETGAAAVQNIGAYGVEIKDVIESVEAFNQFSGEKRQFSVDECEYTYRRSFFKIPDNDPYIVTHVNLRLQKQPVFNLEYAALDEALKGQKVTLQSVRDAVISVRSSKLPDPAVTGNAGSFFMNPVVAEHTFNDLKARYPEIPSYPSSGGTVKIPAGWLIERCGFKGKRCGNTGVYEKQALVLVNYGGATGAEIADFAETVIEGVRSKFAITLQPEVRIIY